MIRLEAVSFAYPRGREVVSAVELDLEPGSFLGVLGPNGSGKSTLLKLAAGILKPVSGRVLLAGRPIESYPRLDLARRIAYVPQQSSVGLPFTVAEVVLLGRHPYQSGLGFESAADLWAVERALEVTGAVELAGRPYHSLSGGERQRVLIARAMAQDAPVLLLDEPTAALDLKHELRAWEILERLVREEGRTVVSVTHQVNLAALFAPRLLLLKEGRVVSSGTPAQILRREVLEPVYETSVRVVEGDPPFVLPQKNGRRRAD